jgi:hypothetical protein
MKDKNIILALKESLRLQNHYAEQLNSCDNGQRMKFNNIEGWINNLKSTGVIDRLNYSHQQLFRVPNVSFNPSDVLFFIGTGDKIWLDKYIVNMNSARYYVFKNNLQCVTCGISGKVFYLEKQLMQKNSKVDKFHFNLYAIDDYGIEILMTKDHIIPLSKKGQNNKKNYQTMCQICNSKKSNNI